MAIVGPRRMGGYVMTTMLERVARAIYGEDTLDGLGKDISEKMMNTAKNAIQAMMEPNENMIIEGCMAIEEISLAMEDREMSDDPSDMPDYDGGGMAKAGWQAMLTAALSEGK